MKDGGNVQMFCRQSHQLIEMLGLRLWTQP